MGDYDTLSKQKRDDVEKLPSSSRVSNIYELRNVALIEQIILKQKNEEKEKSSS